MTLHERLKFTRTLALLEHRALLSGDDSSDHAYYLARAARTNDPDVARAAAERSGFMRWVARYVVATLPSGSTLHKRTNTRGEALIELIRRRASLWSETDKLWHADGTLNVDEVVWQLAEDLVQQAASTDLTSLHPALRDYIERACGTKDPVNNIGRSFERWLKDESPSWPTRDGVRAQRAAQRDPAVERNRRRVAAELQEAAAEFAAWDSHKTAD